MTTNKQEAIEEIEKQSMQAYEHSIEIEIQE